MSGMLTPSGVQIEEPLHPMHPRARLALPRGAKMLCSDESPVCDSFGIKFAAALDDSNDSSCKVYDDVDVHRLICWGGEVYLQCLRVRQFIMKNHGSMSGLVLDSGSPLYGFIAIWGGEYTSFPAKCPDLMAARPAFSVKYSSPLSYFEIGAVKSALREKGFGVGLVEPDTDDECLHWDLDLWRKTRGRFNPAGTPRP